MAFYQKYRPKNLQEIVGQEFVRQTLQASLQKDQVAHAYLFFGSRGTGKTSTARILAKALNCKSPTKTGDPCNTCAHCLAADAGSFVDMIEIDGASNRKIEHARALIEKINFSPTLGKRKVYIIDEVHMLTKEAFNALLKTIEEPPDHAVFLLATTELQKVPETIRSRCQTFTFHRFTPEQIAGRLQEIADHEGITVESRAVLLFIAKKASGGLRDAIGLFEQASSSGKVSLEHLQQELGVVSESLVLEFLEMLSAHEVQNAIDFIGDIASEGLSLDGFLEQLLGALREQMIHFSVGEGKDDAQLANTLRLIDLFDTARRTMRDAAIPTLPLEIAAVKAVSGDLSDLPPLAPKEKKNFFSKAPKKEEKKPIPPSQKLEEKAEEKKSDQKEEPREVPPQPLEEVTSLTSEALQKKWGGIVTTLPDAMLKAALGQAQATVSAETEITISFAADSWKRQVEEKSRYAVLTEKIREVFGPRVEVSLTVQSVILEPVSTPPASSFDEDPVTDPSVISEILGVPSSKA